MNWGICVQTVNIRENEEMQKDLIEKFIARVRNERLLSFSDYEYVFEVITKIASLECEAFDILPEYEIKSNNLERLPQETADKMMDSEWNSFDIAETVSFNSLGNDITFFFDPAYFCKRYFGKVEVKERLRGVVELLVTIYHEVEHAIKDKNLGRSYLSAEILEVVRELLIIQVIGEPFYEKNYKILFGECYAEQNSYSTTMSMITDPEVLEIAEKEIKRLTLSQDEFAGLYIGKIEHEDELHNKSLWTKNMCDNLVFENPKLLYEFPILGKIYSNDGVPKGIFELFEEMTCDLKKIIHRYSFMDKSHDMNAMLQKEFFDCQTFYYEAILPKIKFATEHDYIKLAEKYGVLLLQNFLSGMETYINEKARKKLEFSDKYKGDFFESSEEIKGELKESINAIIRVRNGLVFNPIAEKLLREGGFVRGTRELLPEEILKRREMFSNSLIGIYDLTESESEYNLRAESEKKDIDEIVGALYYNRFKNFLYEEDRKENEINKLTDLDIVRMIQLLKAVKTLARDTNRDYFREFLRIPDVNRLIISLESDTKVFLAGRIKGKQLRMKKEIYPRTEAEEGKYKGYINGNESTEDGLDMKSKITMLNDEIDKTKNRRSFISDRN